MFDFSQLNTQRLGTFQQFGFRLDKRVNWRCFTLDLFFDVQNAFVLSNPAIPSYAFQRLPDNSDFATTDGQPIRLDSSNGIPLLLTNNDPITTPTRGFILEL